MSFDFLLDICWFYSYTLDFEDVTYLGIWSTLFFILLEYSCLLLVWSKRLQWWSAILYLPFQHTESSESWNLSQTHSVTMPALCWPESHAVFDSLMWIFTCFATGGLPQKTLLGVVCNVQCTHHIALRKFNIFQIPNHIWTQRPWISHCPNKIWKIWTDFVQFNYVFYGEFLLMG